MIPLSIVQQHRQKIADLMLPNSVLILFSADMIARNADVEYPFRQESSFWYCTGFDEPSSILVLRKNADDHVDERLYVQPREIEKEIWTGYRAGVSGAKAITGITDVKELPEFETDLSSLLSGMHMSYFDSNEHSYSPMRAVVTKLLNECSRRSPSENLTTNMKTNSLFRLARMYKDDWEIDQMQQSNTIAIAAHTKAVQMMRKRIQQGDTVYEYQVAADIYREFQYQGLNWSYPAIVAGGNNACTLHYMQNNAQLRVSDLLLIDAGCELNYYASDITRCYPISGTFSSAQKAIYELVLQAQLASIAEVARPGATYASFHAVSTEVLTKGLLAMGLLQGSLEENIANRNYCKYFMHGIGHHIGLDVHDSGIYVSDQGTRAPLPLTAGMAVTVEPGLYLSATDETIPPEYRGIGIRIEDDIVKTENGILNLTADLAKTVSDIEKLCA